MKREEIDELATSCGAETRTVPGVGVHIIYNDNRITNFVGRFANAIEARTIERCKQACKDEYVDAIATGASEDFAYNNALDDAANAIEALKDDQ